MKCPCCQTPEKARIRYCRSCGHAYATEDLLEMSHLEFLLKETAGWEGVGVYRNLYLEKLEVLKRRLVPQPVVKPASAPVTKSEAVSASSTASIAITPPSQPPASEPAPKPIPAKPIKKTTPPKEKVPFDQWLLSERNIKIALYSGAILLVLAGIIFIGVNWVRFPGWVKFGITSLVTFLTYFSGYQLFKRPALKLGGNALFGIAGGFFALNFGVLQIYVLGPQGLQNDVMWLITSPICLGVYLFTAFWTKSDLFTYLSIAAVGSTLTAALVVASVPTLVFILAFSLLAVCLLASAVWLKKSTISAFTVTPLVWVSQILMPAVLIIAGWSWVDQTGCTNCSNGSPFLSIASIAVGGLFYIFTDIKTTRKGPRWVVPVIFTTALAFTMIELDFSDTIMGIGLMLQALAYLWIGYWLDRKSGEAIRNVTFYIMAFLVALYLTYSTFTVSDDRVTLIIVLFGDVILLGCTSFIKRDQFWLYGAVWLMMLPIYLLADLFILEFHYQGLVMFGLGLLNLGVGFIIGRRHLDWSGPFLTAAALLSVISVIMTMDKLLIASTVLVLWFVFYLMAAIWLRWTWLIAPGLVAANIAIATLNIEFIPQSIKWDVLTISYAGFGVLCWLVGRRLSQIKERDWSWPLYTFGTINIIGSYLASLWLGEWLAISVSLVLAALFLDYASLQPARISEKILIPILPYLGVGTLFVAHFYLVGVFSLGDYWPAITVGICSLFAIIAWLLKGHKSAKVYELPFRLGGLGLMVIPLAGSFDLFMDIDAWVTALTYVLCGAVYLVDAGLRRFKVMAFPGVGLVFAAHFFILDAFWAEGWNYWPVITVGVCALFVITAWLLRGSKMEKVYELSFRLGGLGLMLVALVGIVSIDSSWAAALAIVICGAIYLMDAGIRRLQYMAYLGVVVVFIAHFFVRIALWPTSEEYWYPIAAGVCISFTIVSLLLKRRKFEHVYHPPFRIGGLVLMLVPLGGVFIDALFSNNFLLYALTFGLAGVMYFGDAVFHDLPSLGYLGIFNFIAAIWAVLLEYEVNELQAFVLPFGLALLGMGWYERIRYKERFYRLFTMAGCLILLGTAFYQSIPRGAWEYALLVGIESIIAITWGIYTKSRGYVQVGGVALIANAMVQFIPSFLEWSRWMQIGLTGSILLGLGLLALFRREKLLETRRKITTEWRSWKS